MSVLVLIPARGGSKRLPGKNLRTVGGKSLVAHAVRCAQVFAFSLGSEHDADVFVDTDDAAIAFEATMYGARVPFMREREYAQDDTSSVDSTLRFIDRLDASWRGTIVLLQPTSPLRIVNDVISCWINRRPYEQIASRNAATGEINGAVYITPVDMLRGARTFVPILGGTMPMPPERSIDINTAEDLAEAERLWRLQHG